MKKFTFLIIIALTISFGILIGENEVNQAPVPSNFKNQETRKQGNCCSCHDIGQLHNWGLNCEGNIIIWWEEEITFGR